MKYTNPEFKSYIIDEAEQRSWWSPEKDKAEQRRKYELITLKSGMWPVYVYAIISLISFIVFISYIIVGGKIAFVVTYFCNFIVWGSLAIGNYSTLRKLKARAVTSKTPQD